MSWHPNSNKHKAQHGGYRRKPLRSEVKALMSFYGDLNLVAIDLAQEEKDKKVARSVRKESGSQLSFDF